MKEGVRVRVVGNVDDDALNLVGKEGVVEEVAESGIRGGFTHYVQIEGSYYWFYERELEKVSE